MEPEAPAELCLAKSEGDACCWFILYKPAAAIVDSCCCWEKLGLKLSGVKNC